MGFRTNLLLALLAALLLPGAGNAQPNKPQLHGDRERILAEAQDITGTYAYKSSDAKESYSGIAMIRRHGSGYSVSYLVCADSASDGVPEHVVGAGVRVGDILSVGWLVPGANGVARGVSHYRIAAGADGPRLQGQWTTVPGDGQVRREELRFVDTEKSGKAK